MTQPLIITCALVGAEVMREQSQYIPYTPEEIAKEALAAARAGAAMVHVHGRKTDGAPTQDRETFHQILNLIRKESDVIIQMSTGGAVGMSVDERCAGLAEKPEMATLTTGTVNFGDDVFMNSRPMMRDIARRLSQHQIMPEFEIFDAGHMDNANWLIKQEKMAAPYHYDFVLGVPGGLMGERGNLDFLISKLPREANCTWRVAGIGRYEFPLAEYAISIGGHVRVGLEDNIFIDKGVLAKGNAELVKKVVSLAQMQKRPIATNAQAREMLGLKTG